MGCAPSIHISDSRVVYHSNKDPEDSNSSQQGNPVPGLFIKSSNTTSYKLRTNLTKKDSRDNMEAESRTKRSSVKVNGGEKKKKNPHKKTHTKLGALWKSGDLVVVGGMMGRTS